MTLRYNYGYLTVIEDETVAHDADDFHTRIVPIHKYRQFLLTYTTTIDFSGGSSPGLKFTAEGDISGEGDWVALSTLMVTGHGYAQNATDVTITSTGDDYRYYNELGGLNIRIKVEVTGSPTGGTATIDDIELIAQK